jgi:hypothetical protein
VKRFVSNTQPLRTHRPEGSIPSLASSGFAMHLSPRWWLPRLALLSCLLLPALSAAQCPGVTTQLTPFAMEELVVGASVTPLTPQIYRPTGTTPILAVISVEGGNIRYQLLGTPTSSTGHPMPMGTLAICGVDSIQAFRAIRESTDAVLTITYYKVR